MSNNRTGEIVGGQGGVKFDIVLSKSRLKEEVKWIT